MAAWCLHHSRGPGNALCNEVAVLCTCPPGVVSDANFYKDDSHVTAIRLAPASLPALKPADTLVAGPCAGQHRLADARAPQKAGCPVSF